MKHKTKIEWTHVTDNIIVAKINGKILGWWCRKRSEGCKNCFSAKMNQNDYWHGNHLPYSGEPPELVLKTDIIDGWARQRLPKRHFVASMTDVFGEWLPPEWIERMLDGMAAAPRQTFQVLSKREDIMYSRVMFWLEKRGLDRVPDNIQLGQSVENQAMADLRVPWLLKIPSVHFLSIEPLIAPVTLQPWLSSQEVHFNGDRDALKNEGFANAFGKMMQLVAGKFSGINWVIVGGESGPGARPMHPAWVRNLRDQCVSAGVPFFFKQWGEHAPWDARCLPPETLTAGLKVELHTRLMPDGTLMKPGTLMSREEMDHYQRVGVYMPRIGKKAAGRLLDGRTWDEFPKVEVLV